MSAEPDIQVPAGFGMAHEEWLAQGGEDFRIKFCIGPHSNYYNTQYWALVRQAVLARDSATCFRCQGIAGYVHHLSYKYTGKDHLHPETLASVCGACHQIVEYARLAESLMSKIRRRISLCTGFLENQRGCLDQNATRVYARLLEYQDKLAELERLFVSKRSYKSSRSKSTIDRDADDGAFDTARQEYEEQAAASVSRWEGSEQDKARRLIPMLEQEILRCQEYAAKVLEPTSPHAVRLERNRRGEAITTAKSSDSGVEALVVGIRFHRGHVNGITAGESVQLVREPDNAYDPNAVRVNLLTGETLGYLTKEFAGVFGKQLDSDDVVQARVSKVVRDKVYVVVSPRLLGQ